jgi:hypothetical protein
VLNSCSPSLGKQEGSEGKKEKEEKKAGGRRQPLRSLQLSFRFWSLKLSMLGGKPWGEGGRGQKRFLAPPSIGAHFQELPGIRKGGLVIPGGMGPVTENPVTENVTINTPPNPL